jgi:lipid A ethanolaminephosphotransferase
VTYLGLPSFGLILLCIGLAALFSALCIAVSVKYLTKPLSMCPPY